MFGDSARQFKRRHCRYSSRCSTRHQAYSSFMGHRQYNQLGSLLLYDSSYPCNILCNTCRLRCTKHYSWGMQCRQRRYLWVRKLSAAATTAISTRGADHSSVTARGIDVKSILQKFRERVLSPNLRKQTNRQNQQVKPLDHLKLLFL